MLIRLQRIYNFLLFHAVILSFLDVLQSFYSNFISFSGTNLLTQCPVLVAVFCLFFTSQEINIKRSPNVAKLSVHFFGPKDIQWAKEVTKRGPARGEVRLRLCLSVRAGNGATRGRRWRSGPAGPSARSVQTDFFKK